jgi:glutamate synthase (ferredoxin)
MSGGIAYVLDESGTFPANINMQMVETEALADPAEIARVRKLIQQHLDWTGSVRARQVLEDWEVALKRFVKVIPRDFKRMLACIARAHDQGLAGDEAIMVAFEENARDLSRVGGN